MWRDFQRSDGSGWQRRDRHSTSKSIEIRRKSRGIFELGSPGAEDGLRRNPAKSVGSGGQRRAAAGDLDGFLLRSGLYTPRGIGL